MIKKAACASGIRTNIVIFYLYISNTANPVHLELINVFSLSNGYLKFKKKHFSSPTYPLRPIRMNNACPLRFTAAAGTKLAGT